MFGKAVSLLAMFLSISVVWFGLSTLNFHCKIFLAVASMG